MTRQILFLIILTSGLSCHSGIQKSKAKLKVTGSDKTEINAKENIRFDFSAVRLINFQETIEIKASLFNDNIDTVYFLSSTCEGEQYSLHYDTAKFELTPFLNCNASYPIIIKIAPKGQHNFQAHFRLRSQETKIYLGFDFYSVDRSFKLPDKHLGDINIFNRPKEMQTIIWAEERAIK